MKQEDLSDWRAMAHNCKYRFYDASRRIRKGNPLCSVTYVGMRTSHSNCPYQIMPESQKNGERSDAETH